MLVEPVGGTVNLLLVLALLIAVGGEPSSSPPTCASAASGRSEGGRFQRPFSATPGGRSSPAVLRLLAGIVFAVAIATQWTSLQLGVVAKDHFAGSSTDITEFYGLFSFTTGVCSFLVQLLITGRVLRYLGVLPPFWPCRWRWRRQLLHPAVAGILERALTNGLDQGFRFSVDKAGYELLYLPIPPATGRRSRTPSTSSSIGSPMPRCGMLGLLTQGFFVLPGLGLDMRGMAAVNLVTSASGWCWRGGSGRSTSAPFRTASTGIVSIRSAARRR